MVNFPLAQHLHAFILTTFTSAQLAGLTQIRGINAMSGNGLFHFGKLPLALIFIAASAPTALAGSSSQFSVGLVISGKNEPARTSQTRFTCSAAMTKVRLGGFSNVQKVNCSGDIYHFVGDNGSGRQNIGVNALTGELTNI